MDNFTKIKNVLNESDGQITRSEVEEVVFAAWKKHMPKSHMTLFKNGIAEDYMIFTCTIGNDKSEYSNGYSQNDPLSLSFNIDIGKDPLKISYSASSIAITPENQMYAFSRKKLPLRKTKVKSVADIGVKLEIAFKKVKDEIKKSIKNGDFDVYDDKIQKIIKSKV